jgi:hypothetical protein
MQYFTFKEISNRRQPDVRMCAHVVTGLIRVAIPIVFIIKRRLDMPGQFARYAVVPTDVNRIEAQPVCEIA